VLLRRILGSILSPRGILGNTMNSFEYNKIETVLEGMTEKQFEEFMKKVLDVSFNPDYVAAIQKIHQIISKQNPNLN
jgi:hypothetical protein